MLWYPSVVRVCAVVVGCCVGLWFGVVVGAVVLSCGIGLFSLCCGVGLCLAYIWACALACALACAFWGLWFLLWCCLWFWAAFLGGPGARRVFKQAGEQIPWGDLRYHEGVEHPQQR